MPKTRKRGTAAQVLDLNMDYREGVIDGIRRRIVNGIGDYRIWNGLQGCVAAMYCLTNPDMNRR